MRGFPLQHQQFHDHRDGPAAAHVKRWVLDLVSQHSGQLRLELLQRAFFVFLGFLGFQKKS
jgi:hypothetical protein